MVIEGTLITKIILIFFLTVLGLLNGYKYEQWRLHHNQITNQLTLNAPPSLNLNQLKKKLPLEKAS